MGLYVLMVAVIVLLLYDILWRPLFILFITWLLDSHPRRKF